MTDAKRCWKCQAPSGGSACPECGYVEPTPRSPDDGFNVQPSDNPAKGAWMCEVRDGTNLWKFYGESYYLAWRAAKFKDNAEGKAEKARQFRP